jgi:large subunit ribosomal protein L3
MAAIVGKKLGMTQVFTEDGDRVPVTVIEAGPCPVTAIRDEERDGYAAVQLAFGEAEERKLSSAELGHLRKAGAPPLRTLVEFRDEAGELKVGDTVTVAAFEPGQRVKVSGISVGKGFAGTIKRHGFARGPKTHGSRNYRKPGSIGASADPARVFPGMRMPGQMGNRRITQRRLEVVEVDAERNLLLVKGSVPGPRNATVEVRSELTGETAEAAGVATPAAEEAES